MEKYSEKYTIENHDLKSLENFAVRMISTYAKGKLRLCRDNVDFVMNYLVRSYTLYNPNLLSFSKYLFMRAKCAIKTLLFRKQKIVNKELSLDKIYDNEKFSLKSVIKNKVSLEDIILYNDIIEYIEKSKAFNQRERLILLGHFRDNTPLVDIADDLNIHRQYAYVLLDSGLAKLKTKYHD